MKTIKTISPFVLLLIAMSIIGPACAPPVDPEPEPEACEFAITYTIDGTTITHTEAQVTAEIWPASNYAVNKKVYDVWTDVNPQFYFHSSASDQDEISQHTAHWQEIEGSNIILNDANLESSGLEFKVVKAASAVGDLLKISFKGTTAGGHEVTNGLICTTIDILH